MRRNKRENEGRGSGRHHDAGAVDVVYFITCMSVIYQSATMASSLVRMVSAGVGEDEGKDIGIQKVYIQADE